MKRGFLFLFFIFGLSALADQITPITWFPYGSYLMKGYWLMDDESGRKGDYASVMSFSSNGWSTTMFRVGSLYVYENVLNIDFNGFFDAKVSDYTDPSAPVDYYGYGNCGSNQCQITVCLDNAIMQKSIIFIPESNMIYGYGAIYFEDGTPDIQWEETGIRLP